jgi:dCMP deaminase
MRDKRITIMRVADEFAKLSTCSSRSAVGAVLYDDNWRIVATGYNGVPQGMPHCNDVGCILVDGSCIAAVHAEVNAILQCAFYGISTQGLNLYCTHSPCNRCAMIIARAGIKKVFYTQPYKASEFGLQALDLAGIPAQQWEG